MLDLHRVNQDARVRTLQKRNCGQALVDDRSLYGLPKMKNLSSSYEMEMNSVLVYLCKC